MTKDELNELLCNIEDMSKEKRSAEERLKLLLPHKREMEELLKNNPKWVSFISPIEKDIFYRFYPEKEKWICIDFPIAWYYALLANAYMDLENVDDFLENACKAHALDPTCTALTMNIITGDTDGKERLRLADDFNTKDDLKVLLVSLKAGGVGLNLIGADTVIHLDPWWNPQVENQASDRVHRIGQKNAVTILRLIMKDTVEEKVLNLQNEKKDLYNEIVEGNGGVSSLSDEDIAYLLS